MTKLAKSAIAKMKAASVALPERRGFRSPIFQQWMLSTARVLAEVFGKQSIHVKQFLNINYASHHVLYRHDAFYDGCGQARNMLAELCVLVRSEPKLVLPPQPQPEPKASKQPQSKKIFVVHGHDGGLKNAVARFLEKLGLEPIILHERPDRGRTVIRKFIEEANVAFAVVLATADDLAGSVKQFREKSSGVSTTDLKARARQNVIFESGVFVGKLGLEGVLLIRDNDVELPSDLAGVVYADRNQWREKLHEALVDVGFTFLSASVRAAMAIRE